MRCLNGSLPSRNTKSSGSFCGQNFSTLKPQASRKLPSPMVDAQKQAEAIYEAICTTSADRPFSFHTVEQMHREIADWQAKNPALTSLRQASPDVQTVFLSQSVEWLRCSANPGLLARFGLIARELCQRTASAAVLDVSFGTSRENI